MGRGAISGLYGADMGCLLISWVLLSHRGDCQLLGQQQLGVVWVKLMWRAHGEGAFGLV